ncbi:O-antigen biosynthesis glycosyltransferase WbnK [Folsomia candida]|uniref:L-Fucosyltransferase n=1 Tax=Folsomia candida TaxID=158441 RepID=A0A226D3F4_FOLCA|nr:O-antigen biosynthesis glycosyltransferase WbnK [Folsomia candida]
MSTKIKLALYFLILCSNYKSLKANGKDKNTGNGITESWASFINTLNHCTIQIFYKRLPHEHWDVPYKQLQILNIPLKFNFVIELLNDSGNRYVTTNSLLRDSRGIIQNFPFAENRFSLIYSNCHVALLFVPAVNPLQQIWGMVAFEEDPDYLVMIDLYPGYVHRQFNHYFLTSADFRVTSIILHCNMTSNILSIVCHTCTRPQNIPDQNDRSVILKKMFPLKDWDVPEFYKRLMTNMNRHPVQFITYRTFWKIPCSLRYCGLNTPRTSCPVTELILRLNFTPNDSFQNAIGHVLSNQMYRESELEERFYTPGVLVRDIWVKYGTEYKKYRYTIFALPAELDGTSLLKIFDFLSCSILIFLGGCSSLIMNKSKEFVFAPCMWTISIFLQQGTNILIKKEEVKVIRFRIFLTYCIILIWLFNAFTVGSIFSGEFFSLFASNRIPPLPKTLKELVQASEIPIFSFSSAINKDVTGPGNPTDVSTIKEFIIPGMLKKRAKRSPEYVQILKNLIAKVMWLGNSNSFGFALSLSLNKPLPSNKMPRPTIFAAIDGELILQNMEAFFGMFKKYFIVHNAKEEDLDAEILPWVTGRTPFGKIFEENIGFLAESGILHYWGKNFQKFNFLNEIKVLHDFRARLGIPEKNHTAYFQKAVITGKESNSVELAKEGNYKKLNSVTDPSHYFTLKNTSDHPIRRRAILLKTTNGLGNQLFQYACHYALARKHDLPLYVRIPHNLTHLAPPHFHSVKDRSFALHTLNVPLFAWNTIDESANVGNITYISDSDLLSGSYNVSSSFNLFSLRKGDYCQSQHYFAEYRSELKELFGFRRDHSFSQAVRSWEKFILEKNSGETVALHIRRGDFVRINATIPMSFYVSAISNILWKLGNVPVTFFVFSDDLNFIRNQFLPRAGPVLEHNEIYVVSDPNRLSGLDEFYLLTKCKNFIIPNSSFAWWAAYLARYEGKFVYAAKLRPAFVDWLYPKEENVERHMFYRWMYNHIYYPSGWIAINPRWDDE